MVAGAEVAVIAGAEGPILRIQLTGPIFPVAKRILVGESLPSLRATGK
jgi:hypothetical protein